MNHELKGHGVREGVQVDEWAGLYGSSWSNLITPESFSHP
jgi:hypothetical protein